MNVLSIDEVLRVINSALLSSEFGNAVNLTEPFTIEQIDLDFNEMQIDSLMFICIVVALEEEFDIEIPDDYLFLQKLYCIRAFYELILELKQIPRSECSVKCDNQLKNNEKGEFDEQKL